MLGHSQCGGIQALLNRDANQDDFITNWVSQITMSQTKFNNADDCAKFALHQSYENCLTFPWIKDKVEQNQLAIHQWYFDIKTGEIFAYAPDKQTYLSLAVTP